MALSWKGWSKLCVVAVLGTLFWRQVVAEMHCIRLGVVKVASTAPQAPRQSINGKDLATERGRASGVTADRLKTRKAINLWEGLELPNIDNYLSSIDVAWSTPARMLAVGADSSIHVWYPRSGQLLRFRANAADQLAWSPNGALLAYAGAPQVSIAEPQTGKVLQAYQLHEYGVGKPQWHPQGRLLATCSDDRVVIWDLQRNAIYDVLAPETYSIDAQWNPDGSQLAILRLDALVLYHLGTKRIHRYLKRSSNFQAIAWSPDGRRIAAAYEDEVVLWDPESGRETRLPVPNRNRVSTVAWSSDGQYLSAVIYSDKGGSSSVLVWSIPQLALQAQVALDDFPDVGPLRWSPMAPVFAIISRSGTVLLYDLRDHKEVRFSCPMILDDFVWRTDGALMALMNDRGAAVFWDPQKQQTIARLEVFGEGRNWVITTADGHYDASPQLIGPIRKAYPLLRHDRASVNSMFRCTVIACED